MIKNILTWHPNVELELLYALVLSKMNGLNDCLACILEHTPMIVLFNELRRSVSLSGSAYSEYIITVDITSSSLINLQILDIL